MQPPPTLRLLLLPLLFLALLHRPSQSDAYNITEILDEHPEFSTFNHYLTLTHLASEINRRRTITLCAVDNAAMSDLLSKGLSIPTLRNVLSLHVLVDYYGAKKLHQLSDGTTLAATIFQSTGSAPGNSGYLNITDLSGGKVGFGTSDNSGDLPSRFVKSILEIPYDISVVQISHLVDSPQAEAPAPDPSQLNLTALLSAKGCKAFSALLAATGADKAFQESVDDGITVFCVGDGAIDAFMPRYDNLTDAGKEALLLYHASPAFYSMGMLKSNNGIMNTLATNGGNRYDFTVQNQGDKVKLNTKLVTATVTATLVDRDPVAVYKIDKVLLPRELFKVAPEPTEAPTPAPAPAPSANSPTADIAAEPDSAEDDQNAKKVKNGSERIDGGGLIIRATMMMMIVNVWCGGAVWFL